MTTLIPRGVTGLLLAALLFVGPLAEADPTRPLLVDSETPIDEVARALTVAPTPQLTYEAARPPSGALAAVLASADAVTLRTPSDLPLLEVKAPGNATAGRRTSLALIARGQWTQA